MTLLGINDVAGNDVDADVSVTRSSFVKGLIFKGLKSLKFVPEYGPNYDNVAPWAEIEFPSRYLQFYCARSCCWTTGFESNLCSVYKCSSQGA